MRLVPYLYTLAWHAHTRGEPLMRPLAYHYPDDPNVWELGSEYLLGPDLLVAPVTRAGATHWPVYLPAGAWYDFWTHAAYEGPGGVSVATPLERVPLFVRGGTLVPTGPAMQRTDERPLDELTLLIYPPSAASGAETELYEDDGVSNAYRRGQYAITWLRCHTESGQVHIDIDAARGRYAGQPAEREILLRVWLPQELRAVRVTRGRRPELVPVVSGRPAVREGTHASWWREGPLVWVRVPAVAPDQATSVVLESSHEPGRA
jgi:alpha-glucosidase